MFMPDRASGLARLEAFLPHAGRDYARRRNFDLGAGEHAQVSRLSPWLRHRLVLEHEVLAAVLTRHGSGDAEKFIDEVFWRSYFRGWMAHHADAWNLYRQAVLDARKPLASDAGLASRVADAEAGRTGNPAVDHWARELRATGYLHNHARMWFASLWIFTLRLPWVLGADFFMRHLLDGDPASNTLSWRWVAGLHTRGKTYLARRDNILRFTEGRIDPGPGIATEAKALEESISPRRMALAWPEPATVGERAAWLITEEDCSAEEVPGGFLTDTLTVGLRSTDARSPDSASDAVQAFGAGAIADGLRRAGADDTSSHGVSDAELDRLVHSLSGMGVQTVFVTWVPFGPLADTLADLSPRLRHAGMDLRHYVHDLDRCAWPHADRGFFRLKKQIPRMLEQLGLGPDHA